MKLSARSTERVSRHTICAKTFNIFFFLRALQGFGRQRDKARHEFHLPVVQCPHRAVSTQRTSVNKGPPDRFGHHQETLTRNFKVASYLQPW